MNAFKDQVAADNIAVFMNAEEFAELNNLNGTSCTCIVQDVVINDDLTVDDRREAYQDGTYGRASVINVCKADLPEVPVMGQTWRVDGKLGLIVSVADDEGILTITWQVNDV